MTAQEAMQLTIKKNEGLFRQAIYQAVQQGKTSVAVVSPILPAVREALERDGYLVVENTSGLLRTRQTVVVYW